jgi:hypothetical protein
MRPIMPLLFWLPLIYITALFEIAASPTKKHPMGSDSTCTNERVSPAVFHALQHLPGPSVGSVQSSEKRLATRPHVTSPQSQSEHFRAKAAECLDRSLGVPDREYQRLYCELAAQWLILAHEADTKNNQ